MRAGRIAGQRHQGFRAGDTVGVQSARVLECGDIRRQYRFRPAPQPGVIAGPRRLQSEAIDVESLSRQRDARVACVEAEQQRPRIAGRAMQAQQQRAIQCEECVESRAAVHAVHSGDGRGAGGAGRIDGDRGGRQLPCAE